MVCSAGYVPARVCEIGPAWERPKTIPIGQPHEDIFFQAHSAALLLSARRYSLHQKSPRGNKVLTQAFTRISGSMGSLSLPPLPERIVISRFSKSTSLIRRHMHSIKRMPVPYRRLAIRACLPDIWLNNDFTSVCVNTVGRRGKRVGRCTCSIQGKSISRTCLYRNKIAQSACLCVDAHGVHSSGMTKIPLLPRCPLLPDAAGRGIE
jgi:hypothetical protein